MPQDPAVIVFQGRSRGDVFFFLWWWIHIFGMIIMEGLSVDVHSLT